MNISLDSLDPRFKPMAVMLLARIVEARIPVLIVNTRRTDAEQADALARGVSWVPRSKHQDGLAIDLVPYETYQLHGGDKLNWSTADAVWLTLGTIGEGLGLRWGGRFKPLNRLGIGRDPGHFEYVVSDGLPGRQLPSVERT